MPHIKNEDYGDVTLRNRYLKWTKAFLVIVVLFFIWIIFYVLSIYYLSMGYRWALLSINEWIFIGWGVIGFFTIVELIFYAHYRSARTRMQEGGPAPRMYHDGKQVHIYTHPAGAKGGIFSKTLIPIDENRLVNVRVQMIPPNDLWGKKEKPKV